MCIIIYKPQGKKLPKKAVFKTAFQNNSDGAGLMIKFDEHILIKKGFMNFSQFYNELRKLNKQYDLKNYDVAIHFRIATSGSVIPENCHPFPVSKKIKDLKTLEIKTSRAIVHNGIIDIQEDIKNDLSDTQTFIKDILSNIKDMYNYNVKNMLENYISSSKIVYFEVEKPVLILNEKLGVWDNDIWYSNSTYKSYCYYPVHTYQSYYVDDLYQSAKEKERILDEIENYRQLSIWQKDRIMFFDIKKIEKLLKYVKNEKYNDIALTLLIDAVEFDYSPDTYIEEINN